MLEDVYASSDANIVMMFFELFYSEKFLSSQALFLLGNLEIFLSKITQMWKHIMWKHMEQIDIRNRSLILDT